MHTKFWLDNLKGRDHSEDRGVERRTDFRETRWEAVDWMHLAQVSDR
jgi:hypothetical protein